MPANQQSMDERVTRLEAELIGVRTQIMRLRGLLKAETKSPGPVEVPLIKMKVGQLQDIAAGLGIASAGMLTRNTLIEVITKVRKDNKAKEEGKPVEPENSSDDPPPDEL